MEIIKPLLTSKGIWALVASAVAVVVASLARRPPFKPGSPPVFDAWPIVGALRFFTQRARFLNELVHRSPSGQASFYYGKLRIVSLAGDVGRKTFFDSRQLDIDTGYAVLFNAVPVVKSDNRESIGDKVRRMIVRFLRRERLVELTPQLVGDARDVMTGLAELARQSPDGRGVMEPFVDAYRLIYQLTMRTVGCDEIAGDPALLERTLRIFEGIEGAGAAVKLILPWFPVPSHLRRLWAGTQMYFIFKSIVDARRGNPTGMRRNDTLQALLDQNLSLEDVLQVIIGSLFAGQINSGVNASWMLCHLGGSTEWQAKVRTEVDEAVARNRTSDEQSPADVLCSMPLDAWENGFPVIGLVLHETIRLVTTGCGYRQNTSGRDVPIGDTGEVVPPDVFAIYRFDEAMYDPEAYPEPFKWNPGRYLPENINKKMQTPHQYCGWGSGLHPCLGIKFAKLEMYVLIAMFVAHFDFFSCDKEGNQMPTPVDTMDRTSRLDSAVRPTRPVYISYRPRW